MNPLFLSSLLEIGKTVLDRFVPDPEKRREAETQLLQSAMSGELKQVLAQLEINAREAMHPSVWVSGWRPFYGWVGGLAFAYALIFKPALAWVALIKGWPVPPDVDTELMMVVTCGLLGIGGLRTYEKRTGVTR